ncbi:L-selectin-like [Coregonus clupeaformis]|uniref:L-selectin-like n=1 Tax=Coregonus clupeaformis TaxID=59861 RepID=UPI001BE0A1D6|nr:L-selectin-like [Coregonus clupeaformis]
MGHSLFLLFFSGLSILPSSVPHQFHFVNINKTWTEAQSFCRQNYTDLATVDDIADMERLKKTVVAGLTEPAWIGLYNRSWRWSLGDTELDTDGFWGDKQPDNQMKIEFCVWMKNGSWNDDNCGTTHYFVCYDTNHTDKYIVITEKKTWSEAQSYCRKNHKDLASVKNHTIQNIIENTIQNTIQNTTQASSLHFIDLICLAL